MSAIAANRPPSAPWYQKVLRVFVFTFIGTFLTAILPIADKIAKGEHVDFTFIKALLLGAVAGAIAAGVRAAVAVLPIFGDDNDVGMKKT